MKKQFRKIVVEVLMLLLVINVYIEFTEKSLTVNWQAETPADSAGFKIYNNAEELIADIPDPSIRNYKGKIVTTFGGISTTLPKEGENVITVRQYDKDGNISPDSLPATVLIIDTVSLPAPTKVMTLIENL